MIALLASGFPFPSIFNVPTKQAGLPGLLVGALVVFYYLLPSIVAGYRGAAHLLSIIATNLLLGWSLIPWLAILVFAVYCRTRPLATRGLLPGMSEGGELREAAGMYSDLKPRKATLRRDPRGTVAILLASSALLSLMIATGVFRGMSLTRSPAMTLTNAMETSAATSASDELLFRASFEDVIRQCGQPEQRWTTSSGTGTSAQMVDHLYYSRVPAEIRLAIRPTSNWEQSHHWTFAGAASASGSASTYSGSELKERMPCMAPWADALAAREAEGGAAAVQ